MEHEGFAGLGPSTTQKNTASMMVLYEELSPFIRRFQVNV